MSKTNVAGQQTHTGSEMPERYLVENCVAGRGRARVAAATVLFILLGTLMLALPPRALAAGGARAQVSVGISVSFGPPPLPIYAQPMCPGPGYMWTPGYWAWDPNYGYFWVPGTWVMAPFPGALWTPGYWGWDPAVAMFMWYSGYWGTRVGFYGGINYGFGYNGYGYDGGYWRGSVFYYNRAVNRLDFRIRHSYNRRVIVRNRTYISYNGGRGGIDARPTRLDRDAERYRRMGAIASQRNQERLARRTPEMRWSRNRGRPDIAATPRPEMFRDRGTSRATRPGGAYRQPEMRRTQPTRPAPPRRYEAQPPRRQPGAQPRGRTPERRNQPAPNRNQRPTARPQAQQQPQYRGPQQQPQSRGQQQRRPEGQQRQPQYRGEQGRQGQAQGQQRGRGNPKQSEKSNRGKGNGDRQGSPRN